MRSFNAADTSLYSDTLSVSFVPSNIGISPNILNNLRIFPNPSHNELVISLITNDSKDVKIGIYTITGKLITELIDIEFVTGNQDFRINTEEYPSGVYYIVVESEGEMKPVKFLKL